MKVPPKKYERLKRFILEKGAGGVVVALSGGVDSSTLAAVCHSLLGNLAVAVTAKSPIHPPEEVAEAERVAREIGIPHFILETDELSDERFVRNMEDRCYHCKKMLLERLVSFARDVGFKAVFEGTSLSELGGHRPGFKAVMEHPNVYSPWMEAGFRKEEIRALAEEMGLSVCGKPPSACLATRIPYGEPITRDRLERIWRAERFIKELTGARQVRVRDHNGLARIEVGRDEMAALLNMEILGKIAEKLKQLGFAFITLDLEGYRTGSMLKTLRKGGGR